jgi:hypothetical protein
MASIWLFSLAAAWASVANAQDTRAQDPFAACPAFPAEIGESLRWEELRAPGMLFCRAVQISDGADLFALTISRDSPFKPRRSDRAEIGRLNGRDIQWYRGELASQPTVLVREALIRFGEDAFLHISLRAKDVETLASHQQLVLSLPLPSPIDD